MERNSDYNPLEMTVSDKLKQMFLDTATKWNEDQKAQDIAARHQYPLTASTNIPNIFPRVIVSPQPSVPAQIGSIHAVPLKKFDKNKLSIYSPDDVDSLIAMLTVWIDDRDVIQKMEKMYKHWKAIQNK